MSNRIDRSLLNGRFNVTLEDRTYDIVLEDGHLTVDDKSLEYHFQKTSEHAYFLIVEGQPFPVVVQRNPQTGALSLTSYNHTLKATVKDEKDLLLEEFGLEDGPLDGVGTILSPMPGLVLSIHVSEGDEVEAGEGLIVLEAMKMENELKAPTGGTVREVHVSEGDAVEKDIVLIEIE